MNRLPFIALALFGLAACDINNELAILDVPETVEFSSMTIEENGDVVLSNGEEQLVVPAANYAQYAYNDTGMNYGYFATGDGSAYVVSGQTENSKMAAALTETYGAAYETSPYSGMVGSTSAAPTSDSATYSGKWAAVHQTDHQDIHIDAGDLTLNYSISDGSVIGAGTPYYGGAEVLTIDAMASGDGSISGTATLSIYPDAIRTGQLSAGFFGEDGGEISGAFMGEGIGGVITAERELLILP